MNSEQKPSVTPTPDGPYLVKAVRNFANQKGRIEANETMALCRCGGSANKPFLRWDTRKDWVFIRQT